MLATLDWKLCLAALATLFDVAAYAPYFKDIFAGKTKPHLYSWLIWLITQGTATAAILYGGGKFGGVSSLVGLVLVLIIFGLSFKYGTRNITRGDTISLVIALLAILVWWQLDNPLLSLMMVTAIDALGYIPTLRKSYVEPDSETVSFWIMMVIMCVLSLIANAEYNLLTVTYLTVQASCNILVIITCLSRRRV